MFDRSGCGAVPGGPGACGEERLARACAAALLALALAGRAAAEAATSSSAQPPAADERYALHAQLTYVEQETGGFHAPYAGPQSLSPDEGRETVDATLYAGLRLWGGAEAWLNGELDQGFGLDGTLGVAGFPSGEAYKIGRETPYLRLPRAFIRQTWGLGGEAQAVDGDLNQLSGQRTSDRLVLTVGKFGVGDVFDALGYAHDPRSDFLNWSALDASTFDYAADAWGYTIGAALEYYAGRWTTRAALFDLSNIPNSPHLDPGAHEFQLLAELEHRHELGGAAGRVLITVFDNRGRMGLLKDAVARGATGETVDVASVRTFRSRTGVHVSAEQALTESLAAFARVGGASGNVEAYEFTDVDRAAMLGACLRGVGWDRPADSVALAFLLNEASATRQQYLGAGGLGILIGDGELPHPGSERILESYYQAALGAHVHLTLDFQRVTNPGFNRDRGPVPILAVRLHAQF